MTLASWTPDLSVGIEALDADHQGLIDTLNGVFEALLRGDGPQVAREALFSLNGYVIDHFRREETWMLAKGYPDADRHLGEHEAFRAQVKRLLDLSEESGDQLTLEVLIVLRDWLFGHIRHSDMQVAAAEVHTPTAIIPGERRKSEDRRVVNLGPPVNMKERRQGDRRAMYMAEVELTPEEWAAHFGRKADGQRADEAARENAAEVLGHFRD